MNERAESSAGAAGLLVTEGLLGVLHHKGLLTASEIDRAFAAARAEAARLAPSRIDVAKVALLIDAAAIRARRAIGAGFTADPEGPPPPAG